MARHRRLRWDPLQTAFFGKRDEQLRRNARDARRAAPAQNRLLISTAAHRAFGCNDGDVPRARSLAGGLRPRLNYSDHRHTVQALANRGQARCRGGVAGDDEAFEARIPSSASADCAA